MHLKRYMYFSRGIENLSHDRHAGYGFQSSWGSAQVAKDLLEDALVKNVIL